METVPIISLFVFLVVLQTGLTQDDSAERFLGSLLKAPKIEIFYNPMDSRSLTYMTTQIYPTIKSVLGSFVDLHAYPVAGCKMEENVTTANETSSANLVCAHGEEHATMSLNHLCAIDFFKKKPSDRGIFSLKNAKSVTINIVTYLMCTMAKVAIPIPIPIATTLCVNVARAVIGYIDRCLINRKDNLIRWAIDRLRRVNRSHNPIVIIEGEEHKEKDHKKAGFLWSKLCAILGRFAPKSCGNITKREAGDSTPVTTEAVTTAAPSSAVYALVMPCLLIMLITALLF